MRERFIDILAKVIEGGFILLAFSLPFIFLPLTPEIFEFPKQLFLIFLVSILIVLWALKMILEKAVKILHSPFTLPILIFLGFFLLSTLFSVHRFSSIFGPYPGLHGGLVSQIFYILIFFLVASNIRERAQIVRILFALSFAGFLIALIGIFHFFDVNIFGDLLRGRLLTPVGSADRTSFFLVFLLPLPLFLFFFARQKTLLLVSGIWSILFIFYIFLISAFAAVLATFLLFLLALLFAQLKLSRGEALRMGILFLLCLALLVVNNWSLIKSTIPFLQKFPVQHDITLDQNTAWTVTTRGFQNLKFLAIGSGPGVYLFNFTSFKPASFNLTPFWDLRFEKSANEYFHLISTLGIFGFLAFGYLLASVFLLAREFFRKKIFTNQEHQIRGEHMIGVGIFASLTVFLFLSLFTTSFTLTAFGFWLLLGLGVSYGFAEGFGGIRETELSLAMVHPRGLPEVKEEILPWLVGVLVLLILTPLLWHAIKNLQAELSFARAQAEQQKENPDPNLILSSLEAARDAMPRNDTYRRALSATSLNFAILGTQQQLLSEQVKQGLLQRALLEGQLAARRLGPHNIFNWENLQGVYTLITQENQDDLLINEVFLQEILLDPTNPRHRNDLGWTYFNLRNDLESAKMNFHLAISLKPDFPDAHYNLARIYREEGKEDLALQEYDQALTFLDQQIASLEKIASSQANLGRPLNQLKQFRDQIVSEKNAIQQKTEGKQEELPDEGEEEETVE